jgi:hypothetical protein
VARGLIVEVYRKQGLPERAAAYAALAPGPTTEVTRGEQP